MKRVIYLILILSICFSFLNCTNDIENLRIRAENWSILLKSLPSENESQDIQSISELLEPSSATMLQAENYYKDWTNENNAKLVNNTVSDVVISDDKIHGIVRYTSVFLIDGKQVINTQLTNWIQVNNQWYRIIE